MYIVFGQMQSFDEPSEKVSFRAEKLASSIC